MKRTDITALFPEATKEQIDKIMDLNGADINAAKGDLESVRGQLTAAQTEISALKAKPADDHSAELQALKDELARRDAADNLRKIREKVATDTGIPASLLTAETEEACKTQAEAIKAYADKKPGYPIVRDGGEAGKPTSTGNTRDKFAEWMEQNFPAKN